MSSDMRIVVGTRGSALALVQAALTEQALAAALPGVELVREVIRTTGDRRTDVALSEVARAEGGLDKGVFTKELEVALAEGRIDLAVHSLKDVPTVLEEGFEIAGTLERAPIRDVLVTRDARGFDGLAEDAVVGTGSVRRARQLSWQRPKLRIRDIRGNVPTRLAKLAGGDFDAILLAEAGLVRLGHEIDGPSIVDDVALHFHPLPEDEFLPAASQGAIGFEIRSGDAAAREAVAAINRGGDFRRVVAEREFLRLLDAGCHTPVGVLSRLEDGVLSMRARVFSEDPERGGEPREAEAGGEDPLEVARALFDGLE